MDELSDLTYLFSAFKHFYDLLLAIFGLECSLSDFDPNKWIEMLTQNQNYCTNESESILHLIQKYFTISTFQTGSNAIGVGQESWILYENSKNWKVDYKTGVSIGDSGLGIGIITTNIVSRLFHEVKCISE